MREYPVEQDVGLRRWTGVATKLLPKDIRQRIEDETREHFVALVEELQAEGQSEGEARANALDRLGSPESANARFVQANFDRVNGGPYGSRLSRVVGPMISAVLVGVLGVITEAPDLRPEVVALFVLVVVASIWAALTNRYRLWFSSQLIGILVVTAMYWASNPMLGVWWIASFVLAAWWPRRRHLPAPPVID